MIMFGSGMSESQVHSRFDIPTLLVGGFKKRGSRHIQAAKETPIRESHATCSARPTTPIARWTRLGINRRHSSPHDSSSRCCRVFNSPA